MTRVLMPFPTDAALASTIAMPLQARIAPVAWRHFPDGESLVTLDDALDGCERILCDEFKDVPESALYMIGAIDEALDKAKPDADAKEPKEDKNAVSEHAA